jgi:ATP-dependent protease ClpP protease subunit
MASTIYIVGALTPNTVHSAERSLKDIPETEKTLFIDIDSTGGNLKAFIDLSELFRERHEQGCTVIGQAIRAESAAFKLFLTCDEREVTPGSVGTIHLPTPNQEVSQAEYEETREKAIAFIRRKTGNRLSERQIIGLDGMPLGSREMITYGIAHRIVPRFY